MLGVAGRSPIRPQAVTRGRRGFTLIELLVVLGVIAVLTALLLPAIQAAREAARRVHCVANLRQIGIALQGYHEVYGMFPPAHLLTGRTSSSNYMSGFAFILPYIEQRAAYNAINMDLATIDDPSAPVIENRTARRATLQVYLCPSDGEANHRISYRLNSGRLRPPRPGILPHDGPFSIGTMPSAVTITDGLSHTALVSEGLGGSYLEDGWNDRRDFKLHRSGIPRGVTEEDWIESCLAAPTNEWFQRSGRYWLYTGMEYTGYSHNGQPNDRRSSCGLSDTGLHPPRSLHSNIVNVLYGDGHVESASDSIQKQLWSALGTHNSGD